MRTAVAAARSALLDTVSERDFQDEIIRRAKTQGWLVHHAREAGAPSGWATHIQGHVGFPDLVLARAGRLLLWELKTTKGRTTEAQKRWLAMLQLVVGVDVRVLTPEDWPAIDEALR